MAAAFAALFFGFVLGRADFDPDWVSAMVAAVALIAAIVAYLSSEETGRREHRAYVEVEPVKASIAILKFVEVTFKVRNYGRTPCKFILHAQMRMLNNNIQEYPYTGMRSVQNLHPGEAKEVVVCLEKELTDDDFGYAMAPGAIVGIQGWFDYFDVFDTTHHETFVDRVVDFR
ncbi:hypothetical protein ABAC460_10050 [Asticcacaulis sp. AC460]|nr:hypothetical protein ABAC460_10050 [Asticcacaulis sp. AC460]